MKTWQTKKLEDVCEFYNGLWKGKQSPYAHVGVIRNTNFREDGSLDDSDIAYLDVEKKQFSKKKLNFGDIVLEKSGGGPKQPVGRVIIFDKKDGDFSFSNFTSAIRVKDPRELDFNFLHKYLFFSYISGVTELMQSHSTGIRNLNLNAYKSIEVPVPPLLEQKRIVKKLDEIFEEVAKAKEAAEKNLQNAKELFESYLNNVFANPGKDWEVKKLGSLCTIKTGKRDVNQGNPGGEYPFFTCARNHTYSDSYSFDTEALLIAGNGDVGHTSYYKGKFEAYQRTYVLSGFQEVSAQYLFLVLSGNLERTVSKQKLGNTMPYIKMGMLTEFEVPVPCIPEQEAIVKKVKALAVETKKLEKIYEQKLADLEELKKSILRKAFAGEL